MAESQTSVRMLSPVGVLLLHATSDHLTGLDIVPSHDPRPLSAVDTKTNNPILQRAVRELQEYFEGHRRTFTVPLTTSGTPFQEKVWEALRSIPYGETLTYEELGQRAGVGRAPRAVGGAVGRNPIPLIVPCHRVLGHAGRITGYSGGDGIPTKEKLLALEGIPYRASRTSNTSSPRSDSTSS